MAGFKPTRGVQIHITKKREPVTTIINFDWNNSVKSPPLPIMNYRSYVMNCFQTKTKLTRKGIWVELCSTWGAWWSYPQWWWWRWPAMSQVFWFCLVMLEVQYPSSFYCVMLLTFHILTKFPNKLISYFLWCTNLLSFCKELVNLTWSYL